MIVGDGPIRIPKLAKPDAIPQGAHLDLDKLNAELAKANFQADEGKRQAQALVIARALRPVLQPLYDSITDLRVSQERSDRRVLWLTLVIIALTAIGIVVTLLH